MIRTPFFFFFRLLLLASCPLLGRGSEEDCGAHNWRRALSSTLQQKDDFIVYGITQDCQIFFARSSQLGSLAQIKTDPSNNYCFPNLIQLQLIDNSTLRLLIKQQGNRICVLAINIPPLNILLGPNAFTYSIYSSMPYARCSHAAPPISLEADLSFPDSAYSDVIYFIDPASSGPRWTARQFMLNENDTLMYLDKFSVHNGDRTDDGYTTPLANEFVLSIDAEKNFLFKRHHFRRNYSYECAFDLLFRPSSVVFGSSSSSIVNSVNERSSWLNSIAVDKEVIVFAETDKQSPVAPTRLYVQSTQGGNTLAHCIAQLPYRVELGLFSMRTIDNLTNKPLPKFGLARNAPPRPFHPRPHAPHSVSQTTSKPFYSVVQIDRTKAETLSRLTQTTTTKRPTTTQKKMVTTTTKVYPKEEPPDESEDLTEADAALYEDADSDVEMRTLPASGSISRPPSPTAPLPPSTVNAGALPPLPSTQTPSPLPPSSPPSPTSSPRNDTLQSKSSLSHLSLISAIVALLVLLST